MISKLRLCDQYATDLRLSVKKRADSRKSEIEMLRVKVQI